MPQEIRTQGYGSSEEGELNLHGFTEKVTLQQSLEKLV